MPLDSCVLKEIKIAVLKQVDRHFESIRLFEDKCF